MDHDRDIQSLDEEHGELVAIVDTMAEGLMVLDASGRIRRWNRSLERLTGYGAEEALGETCGLLHAPPGDPDDSESLRCEVFARGEIDRVETQVRRRDGSTFPALVSARVMRSPEGEPTAAVLTVTDVSELKHLQSEVDELRRVAGRLERVGDLVGQSPPMRKVFKLVELAAASSATVLVSGETGTGKELVARAIHRLGDRAEGPFVTVNCTALSESLLESELFGHARGAFTGAMHDRIGRFEMANGGTLFLDEVGELSPAVQVKLLRVLQDRVIERVGESRPRPIDVRLVAATHRDLRRRVAEGLFREDLFYRLKVFPIHLPPLRERRSDIVPLIDKFISDFNGRTGKRLTGLNADAVRLVMDYGWPGNVRELENAVEHAFVTCSSGEIGPFDLPIEIRQAELRPRLEPEPAGLAATPAPLVRPTGRRRRVSREEMLEMLEACDWNKAEVGRRLGLTRTSIWRKMKSLGIPLDPPA